MQIEKTTPAVWYCITCTAPVTVSAELNCIPVTLASLDQEGQATFCAPCKEVTIETDGTYTVLPTEAPGAQPFGGYVNRNLTIGHAARAAVCTLTAGDMAQGGSLTDGTHTVTLAAPANGYGSVVIADATAAGTITFGTHEAIALDAHPATYATGGMAIIDPTNGGTLTIGAWSKTFAAAQGEKASGTFYYMNGAVTVDGTPVTPPADSTSVEAWNDAFLTAGVGLVCTAASPHGEIEVSVEAAEPGTAGNSITISVETYPDVTLSGGTDGRTVAALLAELEADTDFPCALVHDGEGNVTLTAKVAGTAGNYSMSCTDADFISTDTALAGGQDARTPQEVVEAIAEAAAEYLTDVWLDADEQGFTFTETTRGDIANVAVDGGLFSSTAWTAGDPDWTLADVVDAVNAGGTYPLGVTALAGENGTYTLTETTEGLDANQRVFTATGPFGSGGTRQGSTTSGLDKTDKVIKLNGELLDVEPAPTPTALTPTTQMRNRGVYTVDADIDATAITIPANATAEIWVRIGATALNVQLPTPWSWVNGTASDMDDKTHTTFCIAVRNDGVKVLASMQYSYDTTPARQ